MTEPAIQLPVFVYGTLQPGMGNYPWANRVEPVAQVDRASLTGFTIHSLGGFPGIVPGEGTVYGTLLTYPILAQGQYQEVLRTLDRLEGYRGPGNRNNHYNREEVTVTISGARTVRAYAYVYNGSPPAPAIESGRWEPGALYRYDDED